MPKRPLRTVKLRRRRLESDRSARPEPTRIEARLRRPVGIVAWAYLVGMTAACALLWLAGDRWWPATLLTFGPRWVALAPLPILVPLALVVCRRGLIPLAVGGILAAGPFMGFCIPWRTWLDSAADDSSRLRIMSYNCGEGGGNPGFIADFVSRVRPDVIVLPEGRVPAGRGGAPADLPPGWHLNRVGGVFIASRFPILRTEAGRTEQFETWRHPAVLCELETPWGVVAVTGVHLATPRSGLEEVAHMSQDASAEMDRLTEGRRLESEMASRLAAEVDGPSIVAGDFNMTVDSTIFRDYWANWQDAFSTAGFGFGYTKFTRVIGVRIDHVLASRHWQVLSVWVGPDLGGDHRPVICDLTLRKPT